MNNTYDPIDVVSIGEADGRLTDCCVLAARVSETLALARDNTRCPWPDDLAHQGAASYFPKFPAVSRRKQGRLENMENIHAFFPKKALIFQWQNFFTGPWKIKTQCFPERSQSSAETGLENMEIMARFKRSTSSELCAGSQKFRQAVQTVVSLFNNLDELDVSIRSEEMVEVMPDLTPREMLPDDVDEQSSPKKPAPKKGKNKKSLVGKTDEIGWNVAEDPVHVNDFHATILHLLDLDHLKLKVRFNGLDVRLTNLAGKAGDQLVS